MPYPTLRTGSPLITILTQLGLTTGLKLCLDVGDSNSYPVSGLKWLDTSGGGYDFWLGTDSTSSLDPTFNGTVGGLSLSEYWSGFNVTTFPRFTYDTTNETWMNNRSKAGAKWSIAAWIYIGTSGIQAITGNNGGTTADIGTEFGFDGSTFLRIRVNNGSGTGNALSVSASTLGAVGLNTWLFCSMSLDEAVGANGGFIGLNSSYETFTSTYSSPSSSNPVDTLEIADRGRTGGAGAPLLSGARMSMIAMWEGTALTQAQMTSVYNATQAWFAPLATLVGSDVRRNARLVGY